MIGENNKHQDELSNIMNGLAESVLEMPDDEIEAEIREEGDDTEDIRQVLLNAVKFCRQENLREARERYEKNLISFQETKFDLPDSPEEKRSLIQSILESLAPRRQLTAQFRDFENMPDEDLDGVLLQLFALQSAENHKTEEE
jgi:hypothetical protein